MTHKKAWVAFIVLLYAGLITSHWHPYPDSAVYLLLARSMREGTGYAIHGFPHGKYPPGIPIYLASMTSMGLGSMLALNTAMVAMGLTALGCAYGMLRELTTIRSAWLITLVLAFCYEGFQLAGAQLSDIPFVMLVNAGLWALLVGFRRSSGWFVLGAVLLAVSCWVRVVGVPLLLAVSVGLLFQAPWGEKRRVLPAITILAVGALAAAAGLFLRDRAVQSVVMTTSYAAELSAITQHGPVQWVWNSVAHAYLTSEHLSRLLTGQRMANLLAVVLFWVPITIGGWRAWRKKQFIIVLAVVGYLAALFVLSVSIARYLLPMAPLLLLFLGNGVQWLTVRIRRRSWQRSTLPVFGALLLVGVNLPKDVRLVYLEHHPDRIVLQGSQDIYVTADFLRRNLAADQPFISERCPSVLSYFADRPYDVPGVAVLGYRTPVNAFRDYLRDTDVDCILLWTEPLHPSFPKRFQQRKAILLEMGYRQAFVRGQIRAYCRHRSSSENAQHAD